MTRNHSAFGNPLAVDTSPQPLFPTSLLTTCLAMLALQGCGGPSVTSQLQGVAKSWALTIRASQVIPVYPLTADIRPGDIFLSTVPIEKQAEQYEAKGFLQLDMHIARLRGVDYASFYTPSHHAESSTPPPTPEESDADTLWSRVPKAAFPSYSFEVSKDDGFQLAVPVRAVPLALGLTGASKASGSIAITDAYTYGCSYEELIGLVQTWAANPPVVALLSEMRKSSGIPIFIRAINRVYLAGAVTVSLLNEDAKALDAAAGQTQNHSSDETGGLINQVPSGTLRIRHQSKRSVAIDERFPRPLIVGYLAFDFPVYPNGSLGTPIATSRALESTGRYEKPVLGEASDDEIRIAVFEEAISGLGDDEKTRLYNWAAAALGTGFENSYRSHRESMTPKAAFKRARTEDAPLTEQVLNALFLAWKANNEP